jgi:hypothetical protein
MIAMICPMKVKDFSLAFRLTPAENYEMAMNWCGCVPNPYAHLLGLPEDHEAWRDPSNWKPPQPPKPAAEPRIRERVDLPAEPDDEPSGPHGGGEAWSLLDAWADHNGVDAALAMLICASAAAHAAGPRLDIDYEGDLKPIVLTLIAATEDLGFHQAVSSALSPMRQIQQGLFAQYGELPDIPPPPMPPMEPSYMLFQWHRWKSRPEYKNPALRMDPDRQPDGAVRLLMEGALPAKPLHYLGKCHLYAALAFLRIDRLPRSEKARYNLLFGMACMNEGRGRYGQVTIRGFIRFSRNDLEWILGPNGCYFTVKTLPVESGGCRTPDAPAADAEKKRGFDRLHRKALRDVLRLRFDPAGRREVCRADFSGTEVVMHYEKLRQIYRDECYSVSHKAPLCRVLPDLLAWYLLRLGRASCEAIDEMEIVAHAFEAARRIRRMVAGIYDRHDARIVARKRRALAQRLVNRMDRLGGPSKRRELARGLNKQRIDRIAPMIELLVNHGVFHCRKGGELRMNAPAAFEELGLEAFMPPLEDLKFSCIRRLNEWEQQSALEAAPSDTTSQDPASLTQ